MKQFRSLYEYAARHHHVVTRAAAGEIGIPARTFTRLVRTHGWPQLHRGVWALPGVALTHRTEVQAGLFAVGAPALATGGSALWLRGVLRQPPRMSELLLPANRWVTQRDGLCLHYSSSFHGLRAQTVDGLPVAGTARAVADHAAHATVNGLVNAVADVCRLRLCPMDYVQAELDARARFPGRGRLRRALGLLTGELSHSAWEARGRRLLRDAGIRVHPRPLPVVHRGRILGEVDIGVEELRYGVEIDGPPHLLPEVAAADRARDRELGRAGWTIDRFLWTEVEQRPAVFVREVTMALARLRDEPSTGDHERRRETR